MALVVDSTFASPVNFRPLEHGADVVIHSTTKFLNGHHDALGGAVMGTASYIEEVRQKMMVWGQAPDPFACWLLERGLKTIDVRVRRHNENAMRIATWASRAKGRSGGCTIPGLPDHPDHEIAEAQLDGLRRHARHRARRRRQGGRPIPAPAQGLAARAQPRRRGLAGQRAPVHVARHLTPDERARIGIPDGFLRLSVGIEDADDLIADLEQALR